MQGYLLDGLSFRSQIEGSTIGMHLQWQEGAQTDRAQFIQAFDFNAFRRFEDMLRRYPDVKQAYFKNQERYFDIDAINLTMFQFGVIDEMVGEPRELAIKSYLQIFQNRVLMVPIRSTPLPRSTKIAVRKQPRVPPKEG